MGQSSRALPRVLAPATLVSWKAANPVLFSSAKLGGGNNICQHLPELLQGGSTPRALTVKHIDRSP